MANVSPLQSLAGNMPLANKQAENQRRAAAALQVQQAIGQLPPAAPIASTAQAIGATVQKDSGTQQVQQAQQNLSDQSQIGGMALQQQGFNNQQSLAGQQQGLQKAALSDADRLASLDSAAKQEMFDARKQFTTDAAGKVFLNERKLADYAKLNAQNDEQYKSYAQKATQAHQRNIQILQTAQAKLDQELQYQNSLGEQQKDHALMRELTQAKMDMDKKIRKAQSDAANNAGMWQMGGMLAGAAIGSMVAPGGGTMAGASLGATLGGGLGTAVGSQVNSSDEGLE